MKSEEEYSHGFVIMLQGDPPSFPDDFDPILGFRPDYKGLGVFVYRSERKGKWFVISIQNNGLKSIVQSRDLDSWINQTNSCSFQMMTGARSGIRIKLLYDYIYIEKKEDGDLTYQKCVTNQIRNPFFHHLAIVANNQKNDDRLSNIDINAVQIVNYDPAVYNDE